MKTLGVIFLGFFIPLILCFTQPQSPSKHPLTLTVTFDSLTFRQMAEIEDKVYDVVNEYKGKIKIDLNKPNEAGEYLHWPFWENPTPCYPSDPGFDRTPWFIPNGDTGKVGITPYLMPYFYLDTNYYFHSHNFNLLK